jgi:hypothetical protein
VSIRVKGQKAKKLAKLASKWAILCYILLNLGAGAVEGQDLLEVCVNGCDVAGDLVVKCHGFPKGVQQQQHCQLQVPWMTKWSQQSWRHEQRWQIFSSISAHAEPWHALLFKQCDPLMSVP